MEEKPVERLESAIVWLEAISGVLPEVGGDVARAAMDLSIVAFDDLMGKYVGRVFGCCGEDCWIDYGRD